MGTVYDHERYRRLLENTIQMMIKLGHEKGGEYAGDRDRLANFRRNGLALELPMETIWRVYAGKHWDAVTQYIVDLQTGKERPRMESISGRIDDLLVYLILLKCMVDERNRPACDARDVDDTADSWVDQDGVQWVEGVAVSRVVSSPPTKS